MKPSVTEVDNVAFDNYCTYLSPSIAQWGILFDSRFHQAIIRGLLARVKRPTLLDIRQEPQALAAFASEHIHDDQVGVLQFFVDRPAFDVNYSEAQYDAVRAFDGWSARKVKLCPEVWDGNFEALFSEHSRDLQARCIAMHDRIAAQTRFSYTAIHGRSERLDIECHDVGWITQTGFEAYDYILPTGEVATCPNSLEGTAALEGWMIGTLPFGAKYGFISAGELVVRFSRGQIESVSGTNLGLCADFEAILARLPTLRQVSEVAVGMSRAITSAAKAHTAGHRWHERHLGFHIGLGARIPQTPHPELLSTGPHLDLVFKHGTLHAEDGSEILVW